MLTSHSGLNAWKKNNASCGFTLIEILTVISIMGVLASIFIGNLNGARITARNSERVQDLVQYRNALLLYYDTHGYYPLDRSNPNKGDSSTGHSNNEASCGNGNTWDTSAGGYYDVVIEGFIKQLSADPINANGYCYHYEPMTKTGEARPTNVCMWATEEGSLDQVGFILGDPVTSGSEYTSSQAAKSPPAVGYECNLNKFLGTSAS
ncbi:type II secretion system GspH family protein [Candidatus Parcubacteria bacterium]|nr:type II secretion system GspH family protein [Candidatus Parcubacteria bacterium]